MTTTPLPEFEHGQEENDIGRNKVRQIFRFLKDFNGLRNPLKRQISEQPWVMWFHDLPDHPCILARGRSLETLKENELSAGTVLRVRRPIVPIPPGIPAILDGWIPPTWKDPSCPVEPIPENLKGTEDQNVEKFGDSEERVHAFASWKTKREEWVREALPALRALGIFSRLYELQGRVEREGESVQLAMGQGILYWQRQDGDIRHPVLLQRLQLTFDPLIPEFTIGETGQPPELIRPLLFVTQESSAHTISQADEELAVQDIDLLDITKIEGPLRRVAATLHAEGQFIGTAPAAMGEAPQIAFDAVLYLHRRTQGFAAALDFVLEDLARPNLQLPPALLRISGVEAPPPESDVYTSAGLRLWEEPAEVLFTKDANEEQFQIADRLNKYSNVLVQGPPGTGKTHTIANLIGHLLAQGKRILVTAHTSKALRVLREKVVDPLQTLCVSVLDNETESRKQLEASVDDMVARLTSENPVQLDREAEALDKERRRLLSEISSLHQALIGARQDEYREIIVGGAAISPADAARFVARTAEQNGWIPGPIDCGVVAPLSDQESRELYGTKTRLTPEDEIELQRWRPLPGEVPGGEEFARECSRWKELQDADRQTGATLWSADALWDAGPTELRDIQDRLQESLALLANAAVWKLDAIAAGIKATPELVRVWTELVERLEALNTQSQSCLSLLLDHRCTPVPGLTAEEQGRLSEEIAQFLENGSTLTSFKLMIKPEWRKLIGAARVNDRKPEGAADFRALRAFSELAAARQQVGIRWTNQITRRGGPSWDEFGKHPEEGAILFTSTIRRLLSWHSEFLQPLIQLLNRAGFKWEEFINQFEISPGEHMELRRLTGALVESLPKIIAARINSLELAALERKFQRWNRALFSPDPKLLPASPVLDLRLAVGDKDYAKYDLAFRRLTDLHALSPEFQRYCALIERVRRRAQQWAAAIENRTPPHDKAEPPGPATPAWNWLQYQQELHRRAEVSIPAIQTEIHQLDSQLRTVTARLIEVRAWSAQCKRVGLGEQQALQGWKDINRRIGRGTGRRVPGLRVEARRTLAKARNAVPVWIMPLSRVAETFDPRTARFDVVIVDEASQCDVMGMLALYLAKQAVVVGDHEQVSPSAVGQEIAEVEHLISQHLMGIPNNKLYDGKMSLYDLALESFGGLIRLLEHFRCVPQIISFSNDLSYQGAIRPLRDPSTTSVKPPVVAYRIPGTRGNGKTNIDEARTIVALLQAALEQPEYSGKTFGAVSLLGEEQVFHIETLARQALAPSQLSSIQFLCGTAAQFQGDERDVVFLSMVDSPTGGPLGMRQENSYRQRFNVAASRAKDQLWVVHSLDATRDLKPGDLRRRLIQHAEDPDALLNERLAKAKRTESEFERLVMDRLINAGYRVHPQYTVGHYRIDLVVEGCDAQRIAVECDGDRYHPVEKIAEDMARQAVLERIGWRFVRIRGSQFFRDQNIAMVPVFETLTQLGIHPLGCDGPPNDASDHRSSSELFDRVNRRAAEILCQWNETEKSNEARFY